MIANIYYAFQYFNDKSKNRAIFEFIKELKLSWMICNDDWTQIILRTEFWTQVGKSIHVKDMKSS